MDRRSAIKCTSLMAGMAVSSAFVSGFLTGCKPEKRELPYKPTLLNEDQYLFLQKLSNIIIPTTDTPGALELGVPETIETIVAKCYSERNQKLYVNNLEQIGTALGGILDFNNLSLDEQSKKIMALEKGLKDQYSAVSPAYKELKGSIAASFLNTEYVGKNMLEYLPVPGEYQPCIPLSSTSGKAYTYE